MSISLSTANALEEIARRSHDVLRAYDPGSVPEFGDVAAPEAPPSFALDPLSVVAPDNTFFITSGNNATQRYMRDGEFSVRDGLLVDRAGHSVLGFQGAAPSLVPLHLDRVDRALGIAADVQIDALGNVSYARPTVDPKSGSRVTERITVGRLALARFPGGSKLMPLDGSGYAAPRGVVPHVGRPNDGNFGGLQPHRRAPSGIDLDASLDRLQEAYLAFDAIRAAHKARGSVEKTTMDLVK